MPHKPHYSRRALYVHIPFCATRCPYCAFYSTTGRLDEQDHYIDAVLREAELRHVPNDCQTLYIGGGTPSQLSQRNIDRLLALAPAAEEVTIEANPGDNVPTGANRLSLGLQSLCDETLRTLGRRYNAQQARDTYHTARASGYDNVSIDLLYGCHSQHLDDLDRDLRQYIALRPEHISTYCLAIEPGTPFARQRHQPQPDDTLARMYQHICQALTAAGYEHYELSNFALPGRRSRHNSAYWDDTPYIGLGAAAHSYDRRTRTANVDDIDIYIRSIARGQRPCTTETVTPASHYNDIVTTALRTAEGIDTAQLLPTFRDYLLRQAQRGLHTGTLLLRGTHLTLAPQHLFTADATAADLIYI